MQKGRITMLIWINGPYGIGKSALTAVLQNHLQESFIFDAERLGDAIRENMPEPFFRETFEEYPSNSGVLLIRDKLSGSPNPDPTWIIEPKMTQSTPKRARLGHSVLDLLMLVNLIPGPNFRRRFP